MTSASIQSFQVIRSLFGALWERHKRGYIFIGLLLFGIAILFRSSGRAVVILIYALLLACLELLYRKVQLLVGANHEKWWAKQRRDFPRAYGTLAAAVVAVLVKSMIARSWLIATITGAILLAVGIHFHRTYEKTDRSF